MSKTDYLLPHYFKKIGWILLFPGVIFGIYCWIYEPSLLNVKVWGYNGSGSGTFGVFEVSLDYTVAIICTILGLLFVTLSKEKNEDECIRAIRERSLVWALWVSSVFIILATVFIYDLPYLNVMIIALFIYPAVFLLLFKIALAGFNKSSHE